MSIIGDEGSDKLSTIMKGENLAMNDKSIAQQVTVCPVKYTSHKYGSFMRKDDGWYRITSTPDGTELKFLCSGIDMNRVVKDYETGDIKYNLKIETKFGTTDFTANKNRIFDKRFDGLTSKGLSINPGMDKNLIKLLAYLEEQTETIVEHRFLGFKKNRFWGYSRDPTKRYIGSLDLSSSESYSMDELNELLDNSYMLQLALVIGASSAVTGYLGQVLPLSTIIYHFYGDSSQGKTTALMAGESVWGRPNIESGLLTTWNQTENALMQRLANNFGVAVSLDESSINNFHLTSMLYNLSQGVNRQRCNINLENAPTKQWLTTILSSGESSLLEHTNQNTGLRVRVYEFDSPVTLSAEHAQQCKLFFNSNYGYIGRELVTLLEKLDFEAVKNEYDKQKTHFLDTISEEASLSVSERIAENFAVLLLTAKLLKHLNVKINTQKILKLLINEHETIGNTIDLGRHVYNAIKLRVAERKSLYPNSAECDNRNVEGILQPDGTLMMLESTLNKLLRENNFSSKLVCLRALDNLGVLKRQRTDTYFSLRKVNKVRVKTLVIDLNKN